MVSDIDPAAVMSAHAQHGATCDFSVVSVTRFSDHCEPYRLAEALAAVTLDRDHYRDTSELRRQELYGGTGTCAGADGWIKRASEAESALAAEQAKTAQCNGRHLIDVTDESEWWPEPALADQPEQDMYRRSADQ